MWYVSGALWFNLMMLSIAVGVTVHLLLLKTYRPGKGAGKDQSEIPVIKNPDVPFEVL